MNAPLIGARVTRKEDYRFLTGTGQYTDDVDAAEPGLRGVCPLAARACAGSRKFHSKKPRKAPGVIGIFTGEDLANAKVGGLPCGWLITDVNGQPMKEPPHPCLAQGKVRHVGDQVAVVIAETLDAGAATPPSWSRSITRSCPRSPTRPRRARPRRSTTSRRTTPATSGRSATRPRCDAAFAKAAHVTKLEFVNNRLIPNAIEPRAAIGSYSRADDAYTLYVTSQNPHVERLLMTAFVLGLPEHKVRVVAPDVGGGFGSKIYLYAEDVVVTWASKQLNRSVKWTSDRSEAFLSDAHGRDHVTVAELAHGQGRQVPRACA